MLNLCIQNPNIKHLYIVLADSNPYKDDLINRFIEHSIIKCFYNLNAEKMADLLRESEVVICPSSNIAIEAFACGCKLMLGLSANNQENIYNGLISESSVFPIGVFDEKKMLFYKNVLKEVLAFNINSKVNFSPNPYFLLNIFLTLSE